MNNKVRNFFTIALLMLFSTVAAKAEIFTAYLTGAQEVPAVATSGTGYARINVNESAGTLTFTVVFNGMTSAQTLSHIHAPAAIGATTGVAINFGTVGGTSGTISGSASITPTQLAQLRAHLGYVNVHSVNFPNGELRGQLGVQRPVDSDGDGRTDLSVLRFPAGPPSPINYHILGSTAGYSITPWGDAQTDFPAPGDYDGDGKDDISIYRDGPFTGTASEFWIIKSSNGTANRYFFGVSGDQAISRDFDGDGRTDISVFRRGANPGDQAWWYIYQSSLDTVRIQQFGTTGAADNSTGDTPVPGDYDGDGKFDLALYRFGGLIPNNTFIVLRSSDSTISYRTFGNFTTDYILPGDYDGDGKTDYCAARTGAVASSPMVWNIAQSSDGALRVQTWGISSDLPTQGDYDGDARTDLSIYRNGATASSVSRFWTYNSFTNIGAATNWGLGGDFPTATFDAR